MQINLHNRRLLLVLLLLSTCLLLTYAKGGRGGGSRGSGSRGSGRGSSRNRPTYRPAPAPRPSPRPVYRPSPKPAPKPTQRPAPAPAPSPKPASAPEQPVVAKQPASNPNFKETSQVQGSADKQPASNPNFKETSPVQGSADKQPAYNPNYKPDGSPPAGPPPPYSPGGHPAPNAPAGAPPPYQPNKPPPYGAPGQMPPYSQHPGAQYPGQPPAYPGQPGRPPAYPGQSAPYPVQPGGQPYPQQPGANRPYPVQPGSPGGYPQQPGMNRPYPVQPGFNYAQAGGGRPHPQQPLGGNVWHPQSGMPAPAYTNYGGIPTGTNMYAKPHKQKGFLGSLMSVGHSKPGYGKKNKHFGSQPSPYGMAAGGMLAGGMAAGGMRHMGGGGFLGKYGKSAAMYTIFPYMAARGASSLFRPRFGGFGGLGLMPFFLMPHFFHHHHYGYGQYPGYAHYYDIYDNDYAGKCQRPIKKEHTEIRCKSSYKEIKCDAKCEEGFEFPHNITMISNKCWHVTGIWRPTKNFPECKAICEDECMNGGHCIRPGVCKCPDEYRGDRCQFRKLNFLDCDVRTLTKGTEKHVGWVCSHTKNETICKIRCKPPAVFESPAADEYRCTGQGEWTPDSLPRCIVKEEKDENSGAVR